MEDTALNALFVTLCLLAPIALLIWICYYFSPTKIGIPWRPNPPIKDVYKDWRRTRKEKKEHPFGVGRKEKVDRWKE